MFFVCKHLFESSLKKYYSIFHFRDGTIALLDQMVGTTTKATARQVAAPTSINPATQAAILAAAAVAQVMSPQLNRFFNF